MFVRKICMYNIDEIDNFILFLGDGNLPPLNLIGRLFWKLNNLFCFQFMGEKIWTNNIKCVLTILKERCDFT